MVLKLSAMPLTARGTIKLFSFFLWLLTLAGGSKLGMVGADDSSGFCRTSDWKFDLDAVNLFCIEEVKMATDESVILPFITEAMQRGLWECAAEALQAAAALGLSVWEIFLMEHRLLNKELSKLKRVAEHCKPAQTISPAFEWAESPDLIYMNVKFSHRLDAPATLDITPVVTILPNKLEIEGRKGTKEFSLELNLKNDVDPEKCNWTLGSVGRITITLFKSEKGVWTNLLPKGTVAPRNMHTWWARARELLDGNIEFMKEESKRLNTSLDDEIVDLIKDLESEVNAYNRTKMIWR